MYAIYWQHQIPVLNVCAERLQTGMYEGDTFALLHVNPTIGRRRLAEREGDDLPYLSLPLPLPLLLSLPLRRRGGLLPTRMLYSSCPPH